MKRSRRSVTHSFSETESQLCLFLLGKMSDVVWTTDTNMKPTYVSPSVLDAFGYTREERMRQNIEEMLTSQSLSDLINVYSEEMEREKKADSDPDRTLTLELEYLRKNGSTVWMETIVGGIRNDQGELTGFHGVARDISQRKLLEAKRKESEDRFRLLAELAPVGIVITDRDQNVIYVSKKFTELLGYTGEDIPTIADWWPLAYPSITLRNSVQNKWKEVLEEASRAQSEIQPVDFPVRCKDGTIRQIEFHMASTGELNFTTFVDITARKNAEAALKQSNNLMRFIIEHDSTAVAVFDRELKYIFVSQQYLDAYGIKERDVIGKKHYQIFPDLPEKWKEAHRKALAGEPSGVDEDSYLNKDGTIDWVRWQCRPWCGADGSIGGIVLYTELISKRKQSEEALKKSEERYRLLLQNANDAVFVHELYPEGPGLFLEVNEQVCRMLGYTREELLKMTVGDIDVPEMKEKIPAVIQKLLESGQAIFETEHLNKDGKRIPAEISASLFYLNNRATVLSVIRDLTERKQNERILRESEAQFRRLIENAPEALFVQTDGLFAFVNPATIRLFGAKSEEDLIGKPVTGRVQPSHQAVVAQRIEFLNKKRQRTPLIELPLVKLDGSPIDVAISSEPLNYKDKNGSLSFARDITERKTMERERLRYTERLEALLQNIPVMICYPDEQGGYQWVNKAWEITYGWTSEEARRMNIKEQIPDTAERQHVIDFIREEVNTGKWQDFRNRRKDGKDIVTTWTNISLSDGSIIGIGMDITDRKRMESELQSSLEKLRKAVMGIIGVTVNVVEKRDPYTAGHERRVAEISRAIAREMNLPSDEIEGIYLAASIHDIGKIAIPAEILSKPGRLSEIEHMLIRTHSQAGYDILRDIDFPWSLADMVVQHHERYDGKGYPKGLMGGDILLGARIMAVADTVEAMATHRPYRPALGIDMALEEIGKNRNIFYDGEVVDACLRLFKEQKFQFSN